MPSAVVPTSDPLHMSHFLSHTDAVMVITKCCKHFSGLTVFNSCAHTKLIHLHSAFHGCSFECSNQSYKSDAPSMRRVNENSNVRHDLIVSSYISDHHVKNLP